MDNLIFLVKKYIVFLSYFMYMYPLKKNGRTLVTSLDRCRCGNSQRMLTYLFNFDNDNQISINNPNKFKKIKSVSKYIFDKVVEADKMNKHLLIKVHMGIIDHTFIIDIYKGDTYIYQSYIDINPLIITKLSGSHATLLFSTLDKIGEMSADTNKIHISHKMMKNMVRLFGVSSSNIKFEFDDNLIINTKIVDPNEFYNNLLSICWLYYDKFIKLGKLVSFEYLKKNSVEHMKQLIKNKRKDDKLVEEFDGNMLFYEYMNLVKELMDISNDASIKKLYKKLIKFNKSNKSENLNLTEYSEWSIAVTFIKNDKEYNIIKKALDLNILDKMDPSSVLNGTLEQEFDKFNQHGGHQNDTNYNYYYIKYKNKYLKYK